MIQSTIERNTESSAPLIFKVAREPWEFEQIHQLNYATFVEEIPQHAPNGQRVLVDRFHEDNTYLICLRGRQVIGMMCIRDRRPFSLEQKVPRLWSYLPPAQKVCELRLLAAHPEHRRGRVFAGLAKAMSAHCLEHGYDLAIISGTTRQLKLYTHMGFVPFGPLIGTPEAPYQPMYLTLKTFRERTLQLAPLEPDDQLTSRGSSERRANFLPGPVDVSQSVQQALSGNVASHRCSSFHREFDATRRLACRLVNAAHVQLSMGSGTLANDAVAAQLRSAGRGLVLSNGEFGERLIDAAARFQLDFDVLRVGWGEVLAEEQIQSAISRTMPTWLWVVQCETSTGVINDLEVLVDHCEQAGIRLCLDCISSVGTMDVDLGRVWLATATSGKGVGSIPGIGMVFHSDPISPRGDLPRSLDLGLYAENGGIPFTISSNLVRALKAALEQLNVAERRTAAGEMSARLRRTARALGLRVIAPDEHASPAVTTIALPDCVKSTHIGAALSAAGCLVGYESGYLRQRNWLQVCLMGRHDSESVDRLIATLQRLVANP